MAKKKYLICLTVLSFIVMMFTSVLIALFAYHDSDIPYETINMISGIGSVLGILVLLFGIFFYLYTDKRFILNIATPLFCLISMICWIIYADGYADMDFMAGFFLDVGLCALYFMGLFLIKENSGPYNLFGLTVLFGFVAIPLFLFLSAGTLWFFTIAVLSALLGYFFYALGYRFRISMHIFIGIGAAGALFIAIAFNWWSLGRAWVIFTFIVILLTAIIYYLVFTSFGKRLLADLRDRQEAKGKTRQATKNDLDAIYDLYTLYKAGILTDEEYQSKKAKILEAQAQFSAKPNAAAKEDEYKIEKYL